MKMRTQILLAQLPTAIIISSIAFFFISTLIIIKEKSENILVNNFKSILAMQSINKSLEDLNEIYMSPPQQAPSKVKELENAVEQQLLIQSKNIKKSEEKELTRTLHENWKIYKEKYHSPSLNPLARDDHLYKKIKRLTEDITGLNQDELIRTKEGLSNFISNFLAFIAFGSVIGLIFGFYMSWFFTDLFLTPLNQMTEIMSQIGKEEKTTFLHIKGSDEIEKLCDEFNLMTSRLEKYHQSSLGKVMRDYQALKVALDTFPAPIFFLDPQNNILYANKPATQLLGFSEDLKKALSLFHVEDQLRAPLIKISTQILTTKEMYIPEKTEEMISLHKQHKKILFWPLAYPIMKATKNGEQKVEGVVIILQNIRQQPLSQMSKAEAYEALVHEFQPTLLEVHMAIHLCAQEAAGPLTDKQHDLLLAAREKCDYLEKLCRDLLNLSQVPLKKTHLEQEEIDLSGLVSKLAVFLQFEADQKRIFIHVKDPPYLSKIRSNPDQIKSLIGNLFHNAIYYANPGTIIILKLREKQNFIEVSISDKGSFIPVEQRKNIFTKHFKVPGQSEERAGLGLYIAQQITQSVGGKIGVRSSQKQGTTFWVALPVS